MIRLVAQSFRHVGRVKEMFPDPDAGKTQLLCCHGERNQFVGVFNAIIIGNTKADFHDCSPLGLDVSRADAKPDRII